MTQLRAALVGTGFIGPVHVEALRRLGIPVVGILGSTPEKGRAAAITLKIAHSYDTMDELLADPDVDVVHLTSPNRHHFEQCRRVLAAKKHLICEKPLAMTSAETAELVVLAKDIPVVTAVNYNIRFYPLCQEARARISGGALGPVYHVTGSYTQDWLLHDSDFNWRVLSHEGGALRAVADIGTHWLDLLMMITGLDIESVCADLQTVFPIRHKPAGPMDTFSGKLPGVRPTEEIAIDTEDHGSILLRWRGGARGCLTVSQVAAGRKNSLRYEAACARGSVAWDSERPNELWVGHRDRSNELLIRDPALLTASARRFTDYPGGHNEGFPDSFKSLFRTVYSYIEAGDLKAPREFPTFADGHREVQICEAILQSHREQRWVEVPAISASVS